MCLLQTPISPIMNIHSPKPRNKPLGMEEENKDKKITLGMSVNKECQSCSKNEIVCRIEMNLRGYMIRIQLKIVSMNSK